MKRYLLLLACCPLVAAGQALDRRIAARPDGELIVSNVAGSIRITGWDDDEVHVTGELGDNVERLDLTAEGDNVIVRVVLKNQGRGNRGDWSGSDTDLVISAPRTMRLDVNAVSADIDIDEMRGEQRLSSVSGDIETQAYGAEIRSESVSGDIDIDSRDAPIVAQAKSVSGDVTVRGPSRDVEAESVSGDVEIDGSMLNRLDMQTVSGDLSVRAGLADDARVDATSTSGDIELEWLGNGAAEYRLGTFSGEIDTCFGPRPADNDHRPPGVELRFREGQSNARVDVRTHSGDIEVCRQ
jgi:DUF4097 and DUF4098 domain-containing protein YvlB